MVKAIMDRVFIRLEPNTTATVGGIFLPETQENPRTIGIVESIGPDVHCVKVGDKVLFHVFDELPSPNKDIVVVRQNSLLGVFEDE